MQTKYWIVIMIVLIILLWINGTARADVFIPNKVLTVIHETSDEMDSIGHPFESQSKYQPEYNGQKDKRVFTGDIWKSDPEILFSGPRNIVKIEPQIIYVTKEVPVEKIVYVERAKEDDVTITTTWCDDTKEICE